MPRKCTWLRLCLKTSMLRQRTNPMEEQQEGYGDGTVCVHGAKPGSRWGKTLCLAAVNEFSSVEEFAASDFLYRRYGSPNVDDMAAAVARLEEAEAGIATASGMGAILLAILAACKRRDTVLAPRDAYGGTYDLLSNDMQKFGIDVRLDNVRDTDVLDSTLELIRHGGSKTVLVLVETISNPLINVANVDWMVEICKKHKALLLVDNTFATPLRNKPLKQGADMVVHSATKFLCGHSDATAGALVGSHAYIQTAKTLAGRWGLAASPMDAWLVMRGLRTLQVRMKHSWSTAAFLAKRLEGCGIRVRTAPECSMLAFEVPGGLAGVEAALKRFKMIKLSPSLGGTSTTVSHSATSSHKAIPVEMRLALGITDGLLRMSVGLEDGDDVWADLQRGLGISQTSS